MVMTNKFLSGETQLAQTISVKKEQKKEAIK